MKIINDNLFANPVRQDDFYDHFNELDVTSRWTDTSGDTGAAPSLTTAGESTVSITTGATQNNEAYLSTKRHWDIVANRPLLYESLFQYSEADTNAAAVVLGLMSGWAANHLVDTTGVLVSSVSCAVFHKVAGSLAWQFTTRVGTTTYGNNTLNVVAGATGMYLFRCEIRPISSTQAEVVPLVDINGGTNFVQCRDATTGLPVKHILTYTSFAAAAFGYGVKATGATGTETIVADMARVSQIRG